MDRVTVSSDLSALLELEQVPVEGETGQDVRERAPEGGLTWRDPNYSGFCPRTD